MTIPLTLTSFSRTKRTTPEEGFVSSEMRDKRARIQTVSENNLPSESSSSSSMQNVSSSRQIVPILTVGEIVRKYTPILIQPSTLGAIYSGHINTLTKIEPELPYTYFETAIFSKMWILAKMILKADLNLPISIQGVIVPQTELCVLSWAVTNDEWELAHLLLSRNAYLIQTDLKELPSTVGKISKVRSFYFEQSSVIKSGDYDQNLKDLFSRTLFNAAKAQHWEIVELLVEKNPHIPSVCLSESVFLFVFAKQWRLLKKTLELHPLLAKCRFPTPSTSPNPSTPMSPYKNCSMLWFLAYYNKMGIIRSIIHKIDLNLFFETPIASGLYAQTSAFAIISLGDQRDLVEYLLDFVKDDKAYDTMRLSSRPYTISILDHAIAAKKWHLLQFLFEYYLKHRPQLPELRSVKILSLIDHNILNKCKQPPIRSALMKSLSEIQKIYRPIELAHPSEACVKTHPLDLEDPGVWENILNTMIGAPFRPDSIFDHPSTHTRDSSLTEPPEQLFPSFF